MINCKECGVNFEESKQLHQHLRKHKLKVKNYYERHYPMVCLQTGRKLPWKDGDDLRSYLSRRFIDRTALYQYFEGDVSDSKRDLLFKYIEEFVNEHQVAPSQMELATLPIHPNLLMLDKCCSYSNLCKDNGWKTRYSYDFDYNQNLPIKPTNPDKLSLIIDTRERNPYRFYDSTVGKLDVGDYALAGQDFNNIVIDRKEISDFWNTISGAISKDGETTRFQRELLRARERGWYVVVLCEYNLHLLDKYKSYGYANYGFITHNMRNIFREFSDCCQFVFGINREIAARLVMPILLCPKVRELDLQYWVDKHYPPFKAEEFTRREMEDLFH